MGIKIGSGLAKRIGELRDDYDGAIGEVVLAALEEAQRYVQHVQVAFAEGAPFQADIDHLAEFVLADSERLS